jgi:acyl-CoA synthetase (AMP-forming)/AMP-acid ligase II
VPDERLGQWVAAVVQAREGSDPDPDALVEHVRGELAGYKVPRSIWLVDRIQRTITGKADYKWASEYAADHPGEDLCAPRSATNSA